MEDRHSAVTVLFRRPLHSIRRRDLHDKADIVRELRTRCRGRSGCSDSDVLLTAGRSESYVAVAQSQAWRGCPVTTDTLYLSTQPQSRTYHYHITAGKMLMVTSHIYCQASLLLFLCSSCSLMCLQWI